MHKKKWFALLMIFTVGNVPISCDFCDDSCCGESFEESYFQIEDMALNFGTYPGYGNDLLAKNPADTISFDSLAFALEVSELEYVTQLQKHATFSMVGTALACSPVPPRSKQEIIEINITSDRAISFRGNTIDAGESLNEYVLILEVYPGYTIEEFLIEQPYFRSDFHSLIFRFATSPNTALDQSFQFELKLDDGQTFTLNSGTVYSE